MDMERSKARAEAPVGVADVQGKEEIVGRSLFASLAEESRQALLVLGEVHRLPRRWTIASQGEPPRSFVLIGSGRVKIERRTGERALPLGHRGRGEMVGETAVGGATLQSAGESATVVDEVEALFFPIAALRGQLAADGALRAAMAAAIVSQHRALEQRLEGLLLQGVEARLCAFLLDAAERWGQPHPDGRLISAPFTHAEIALLIGSTRETVTLVLGRLKREGLCAFDRRRVILCDPAGLAQRLVPCAGEQARGRRQPACADDAVGGTPSHAKIPERVRRRPPAPNTARTRSSNG